MQGTNLRRYLEKVAAHHGLEFRAMEYTVAEDPGSREAETLYVTHMREPVSLHLYFALLELALKKVHVMCSE